MYPTLPLGEQASEPAHPYLSTKGEEASMYTVLTTNFNIVSPASETIQDTYTRVTSKIKEQLEVFVQTYDSTTDFCWKTDTNWRSEEAQASLDWSTWQPPLEQGSGLVHCCLTYMHQQQKWEVDLKGGISPSSQGVEIQAVWSTATLSRTGYPLTKAPRLLDIFVGEECFTSDLALPYSLQQITQDEVPLFFSTVLQNSNRCTPVVLISPDQNGQVRINGEYLARKLFGLAIVYQFVDDAAAQVFKKLTDQACYAGAVRLYWPLENPATNAPFWHAKAIDNLGSDQLARDIFQRIAQTSPQYRGESAVLRELVRQRTEEERAYRQRIETDNVDWQSMLSEEVQKNASLQEQKMELEAHIAKLNNELETTRENLRSAYVSTSVPQGISVEAMNDSLALEVAEDHPKLWLSQSAWKQYRDASPTQREEFLHELKKLCSLSDRRRTNSKRAKKRTTDCWIWPQGDNRGVRIFYYEHNDTVRVCELADHRDKSYEALLDSCRVFKRNYSNAFKPMDVTAPHSLPRQLDSIHVDPPDMMA